MPMYSTISAWNADETRMILYQVGSGHQLYDGKTYQFIKSLNINPADVEQVYWHTSDPDILFYVDGNQFIRYHVGAGTKDVLRTFSGCSRASGGADPMYISWDSARIGLECGTKRLIYDMSTEHPPREQGRGDGRPADLARGQPRLPRRQGVRHLAQRRAHAGPGNAYEHASLGRTADGHDTYYGVQFDTGRTAATSAPSWPTT